MAYTHRSTLCVVSSIVLLAALIPACLSCRRQDQTPSPPLLIRAEIENFGLTDRLLPVVFAGAAEGEAMSLSDGSFACAGVRLPAGSYSLLVRTWAPHADADGFFVEIDGDQTRRRAPMKKWATMAYPFAVESERIATLLVKGQEPGLIIDNIAVVNGQFADDQLDLLSLEVENDTVTSPESLTLPCLTVPCRLETIPSTPFKDNASLAHSESFDAPVTGAVGEHAFTEGKWGGGLHLGMPDGRFDVEAAALALGATGTIEWWVRPRPARRLWNDHGWHYFLHVTAGDGKSGFRMDVSKHGKARLLLTLAGPGTDANERVRITPRGINLEMWQHMLVSWDFTGERQHVWFLLNGRGYHRFFPKTFSPGTVKRIEFCNTPSCDQLPFLPMDGAIDEVCVRRESVVCRLVQYHPLGEP